MRRSTLAAIAALLLAGGARATPKAADPAVPGPRPRADAADPDRQALAEYRVEVQRLLAQEQRAAGDRRTGLVPDSFSGTETPECRLMRPGADTATSRDCAACHAASGHGNHPVDLDYERARSHAGPGLRPLAEVVGRGLLVPDGELRCVTCHDRRSPWKYRIALPPGAPVRPAVNPRDRATYEGRPGAATPLPPGSEVTPKPLCMACHAFD